MISLDGNVQRSLASGSRPRGLHRLFLAWIAAIVIGLAANAHAYDPQSDGSDGVLAPVGNQTIILADAASETWNTPSPQVGKGVYDSDKWAVVFKYSSVDIPAGTTVSFLNHPKGAPVVWLVAGNVNISGTVNLDGKPGLGDVNYASGGPGGFAGGVRASGTPGASDGQGPGGGQRGGCSACSAGFATIGSCSAGVYGSPPLLPLIGGSGGGGYGCGGSTGGGGGGGAILIAASGSITILGSGVISADGGNASGGGHGSGGGIRLLADQIGGSGTIRARGGDTASMFGRGRIRIETLPGGNQLTNPGQGETSIVTVQSSLFPPEPAPGLRIQSIEGLSPSADPFGNFTWSEDVLVSKVGTSAQVIVQANNVTPGMIVQLRIVPAFGAAFTVNTTGPLSGSFTSSTATAPVNFPQGRSIIQLRMTLP